MKSMLAITHRRIVDGSSLIILLFLTACSSDENTRDDMSPPSRAEQASRINTELGAGYMRRGNYQLAQQKLQKAVAFDPGNAQALSTLAILHEQINEPDEARRYHRQAVKADPEDASVQNNYGAFLCKIGDYRQSEKHFLNAANNAFYQTPELALVNAGRCIAQIEEYSRAEQHLRRALQIAPKKNEALLLLASIKYQQQEFMSARGFLQRYEAVAAPSRSSLTLGYRIETVLDNAEAASSYARQLESLYPGSTDTLEHQEKS
jgi:type IV pilus assembly protein PilF